MQIFMSYYEGQSNMLQLELLISFDFNLFKMAVQFFKTASSFTNFDGSNAFPPNSTW